jgi:uracil-DNA glycosylase
MRNKAYWTEQLGEKWALNLKDILRDPYMNKLMDFVALEYAMRTIYPADQKDVFKSFKLCPWDDVKVVIIGKEVGFHTGIFPLPYSDDYIHTFHNGSLNKISSCIEREYYGGLNLDFDYSLEHWMQQGILFLNTAMTVERGKSGSHIKPWKKFYEAVIHQIKEYKPGTIFLLWGDEAMEQSDKLENQHVFSWESPHIASLERRDWNCPNFKQVDTLMEHLYGTGNTIKW